jgi:hypothetical protein
VLAITNTPTNTAIVPFEGELEHGSPSVVAHVSGDNQSSDSNKKQKSSAIEAANP